MNLFIKGYDHKSAIISGNFLTTAGLGACVQNCKADANKPQGGSQRAREASLILWLLPDNGLSTSMFILCSVLLFSSFTLWCLKKTTQAQNLNWQFLLWRNVFDKCSSSRDVASGVAMTSGRKNMSLDLCLHTCAFQDNYICVPDRRERVTSQLSKQLFGPFLIFIITAFAAWP